MLLVDFLHEILGDYKKRGHKGDYIFYCPFCHHRKMKLEVKVESSDEHFFRCWVCNVKGNNLHSLLYRLNLDVTYHNRLSNILKDSNNLGFHNLSDTFIRRYDQEKKQEENYIFLPKDFVYIVDKVNNNKSTKYVDYLLSRNLTLKDIFKYKIGFSENDILFRNKVIIPNFDSHGRINYYVGRSIYEDGEIFLTPDVLKSNIVGFEFYVDWTSPIVLVEGPFDAMAVKSNAVPLYGNTIGKALFKKIINSSLKEIYICLDFDVSLSNTYKYIYSKLESVGKEVYFVNLDKKDPSKIGYKNIWNYINNYRKINFKDLLEFQINL